MPLKRWQLGGRDIVGPEDNPMIVRWVLVKTPLFAVFWHAFQREDADPYPHDHPWTFVSILCRGGYIEQYFPEPRTSVGGSGEIVRPSSRLRLFPLRAAHRVTYVQPGTRTLVFTGPRRQQWGFWLDCNVWLAAQDYFNRAGRMAPVSPLNRQAMQARMSRLLTDAGMGEDQPIGYALTDAAKGGNVGVLLSESGVQLLAAPECNASWVDASTIGDCDHHTCRRLGPHYRHHCTHCGSTKVASAL